jgi:hypothetical protein
MVNLISCRSANRATLCVAPTSPGRRLQVSTFCSLWFSFLGHRRGPWLAALAITLGWAVPGSSQTTTGGSTASATAGDTSSGHSKVDSTHGHAAHRAHRPRLPHKYTDEQLAAMWPVKAPDALPGAILPHTRIVAYYGNPLSKRMGILGEIPPDAMLARLAKEVHAYQAIDSTTPVIPALDFIVTVAQASAGSDGKYRLRMPDTLIERVASWATRAHALLFLDVQIGRSTVADELVPILKYLREPTVHLALDPEFALPPGRVPGRVIGTMDAASVNHAITVLASLVDTYHLPPKILVVHRFTRPMLRHADEIHLDPRVQVVIDMDGFGPDWMKRDSYRAYVASEPVEYTGFKLFYKNDKPLMTARDVLGLFPAPAFVMFQ